MMEQKQSFKNRVKSFLKRNAYALVVASCAFVLSIALAVTAVVTTRSNKKANENLNSGVEYGPVNDFEDAQASNSAPVVFTYPVSDYTLGNTYSDTALVKNETLNEWTTHLGIDFIVADGADVVASYAGRVESVVYDSLTGTVITIDHGDGLKTTYGSLSSETNVTEGQTVNAGDKIGTASASASNESKIGAHLHFEVLLNGESVNPMNYFGEK